MDNNQYNNQDNGQNRQDYENYNYEHYRYALQRPDEAGWVPGGTPIITGQKKKKKSGGRIAAFALAAALLVGGGGLGGYSMANHLLNPPPVEDNSGGYQDNDAIEDSQSPGDHLDAAAIPSYSPVNSERRAMTPAELYEQCNPAVVAISTETTGFNVFGQPSSGASAGSGFLISDDGLVITNHHVIDGANSIQVLMADGISYEAKVVGSDATADIAVLQLQNVTTKLPYLTLGDSDALNVGDMVVAIGNPLGELANTLTVGYIGGKEREVNIEGTPMVMLQTDAAISPGNSGGPLLNMYGEVIGIVSAKSIDSGVEGIGFAIPASSAAGDIDDLIQNGYITGRPYMGLSIDGDYTNYARQYRQPHGAYIASVESGSCADKAGLKEADIITAINDHSIASFDDLQAAKNRYKAGDTVTITYLREGKEYTTKLTFDETPSASDPIDR